MRLFRKVSGFIAVLLIMAMLVPCAFAEEYDLAEGNIIVTGKDDGTYVFQGDDIPEVYVGEKQTTPTVIYQSNSKEATSNYIRVDADEADVDVTIKNINMHNGFICIHGEIENNTNVNVTFEGTNSISVDNGLEYGDYCIMVVDTSATLQGADLNASLNLSNSNTDDDYTSGLALVADTTTIKDLNVSIDDANYGIVCEGAKLVVDNSNVDINANIAAIGAAPFSPELINCAIVEPENGSIEIAEKVLGDYSAYTVVDGDGEIASTVKIARSSSSKSIRFSDDKGVHEGSTFAFNQKEEALNNIICNGETLEEGIDFIVEMKDGFLVLSFTDKFYEKFGNGPLPLTVDFKTVTFKLSVVK